MGGKSKAGGLSARDHQIAALLASGLTYSEAGERLKVSERTVRRAMERQEVRTEVDAIRARAVEAGMGLLTSDFTAAITELRTVRQTGTGKDATKLNAIRLTIESVLKVREHVTLTREVEELRRLVNEPVAGGSEPPPGDSGIPPSEPAGGKQPDSAPRGPDGDFPAGGDMPGPVAGEPTSGPVDAGVIAGLPASWQE